jgi:hypothetical protein
MHRDPSNRTQEARFKDFAKHNNQPITGVGSGEGLGWFVLVEEFSVGFNVGKGAL